MQKDENIKMSSTVLESPGFPKMESYSAKREPRNLNAKPKNWRNSIRNRIHNQSRSIKLSADANDSEFVGSKNGVPSHNPEVLKEPAKFCNGNVADPDKTCVTHTWSKSATRPKNLHLDRICQAGNKSSFKTRGIERTNSDSGWRNSTTPQDVLFKDVVQQTKRQMYTNDYLLGLRKVPPSLEKPNLPTIPGIILCKPVLSPCNASARTSDLSPLPTLSVVLTPTICRPQSPKKLSAYRRGIKSSSSSSKNKRKRPDPPRRIISLNLSCEVTLHTSENAWKALSIKRKVSNTFQENLEDMCSKLRGLLNKLSAVNFEIVSDQISHLKVNDEELMMTFINIIFEKAIMEPNFSELYAALARKFSHWMVPTRHSQKKFVTFKDLMITRCQHEFEKHKYGETEGDLSTPTSENIPANKGEVDIDALKKKRTLGNIRFIGELFMQDMLQEVVIHQCIVDLLKYRHDEDRLESLCKMLSVVGRKIDFIRSKPRIDQYFKRISDILNRKEISSRVKFMLRDIIELRENNWVPRHLNAKPQFLSQSSLSSNGGFCNGLTSPLKKSISGDESKMYSTLPRNFSYNHKQQPGKAFKRGMELKEPPVILSRNSKFVPSKESSIIPQAQDSISEIGMNSCESKSRSDVKPVQATGAFPSHQITEGHRCKDQRDARRDNLKELKPEQLERKCTNFLNEFLNVEDFEEARLFFEEMHGAVDQCCETLITQCLEKNFSSRSKLGDLFIFTLENGHLTSETLTKSIDRVLVCSEDLEIDIPKVWEYLAEIFFKVLLSDPDMFVNKMFGEKSLLVVSHSEKLMKFLSSIVEVVQSKKSPKEAFHLCLKINKVNERCQVDGMQAYEEPVESVSSEFNAKYKDRLQNILQHEEWFPEMKLLELEKEVLRSNCHEIIEYMKLLVNFIGEMVMTNEEPQYINVRKLKKSCGYLKRLSDENNFGIELLCATQEFVCNINHPYGILRSFFDLFYDEDVVSEEDFDRWYSDDTGPVPGKGVAKESVRKFFEWLHQSDDDEQDNQ